MRAGLLGWFGVTPRLLWKATNAYWLGNHATQSFPGPPSARFLPFRRAWSAVACALAAALVLLLGAGSAEATPPFPLLDIHDGCTFSVCVNAPTGTVTPGPDNGEITVAWTPAASVVTGDTAEQWIVAVRESGTTAFTSSTLAKSTRSHTFTGLDPTKTYDIRVRGANGSGNLQLGDNGQATGVRPAGPPAFVSAVVNGVTLTMTFNESLDTGSVPGPDAFHVTVGGARRTVAANGVAVSGATVTLTLTSAVTAADTVRVRYTKPATNPLQDAAAAAVATFPNQAVTNYTPDTSAPTLVSNAMKDSDVNINLVNDHAQAFTTGNSADSYTLTRLELNLGHDATAPTYSVHIYAAGKVGTLASAPTVRLGTLTRAPGSPTFGDNIPFATTGIELDAGATYFVVIEGDAGNSGDTVEGISSSDEDAGGLPGWTIANGRLFQRPTDATWMSHTANFLQVGLFGRANPQPPADAPPRLLRAGLLPPPPGSTTSNVVALIFHRDLDTAPPVPRPEAFGVRVNDGGVRTPTEVRVSGSTVWLTLPDDKARIDDDITWNEDGVTVSYDPQYTPTATTCLDECPRLRALDGTDAAGFTNRVVKTDNQAPTGPASPTDVTNAPAATIVTAIIPETDFSDADGDVLTFSTTASRDDVYDRTTGIDYRPPPNQTSRRFLFATVVNGCEIANLETVETNPFEWSITLTATDPYGASASVTTRLTTRYSCAEIATATVNDRTLTLTYAPHVLSKDERVIEGQSFTTWRPAASEFTVEVDGEGVALAATNPVAVSVDVVPSERPLVTGDTETVTVTLTLAVAVGANQVVTLSHDPPATEPRTTGFTDQPVTVESTNHVPTSNTPTPERPAAPPQARVSANILFTDLDDDELTFEVSTDRGDDVVLYSGYVVPSNPNLTPATRDRFTALHLIVRSVCELRKVTPALPETFETSVTVTATDPSGAVARATLIGRTLWDAEDCPEIESAGVFLDQLTLTYDKLLAAEVPANDKFAVTVNGRSRAVTQVTVDGSSVVLTLDSPVEHGDAVRLSYRYTINPKVAPPDLIQSRDPDGGVVRHRADSFENLQVTNETPPRPAVLDAVVKGATLTLIYNQELFTGSVPNPLAFQVYVNSSQSSLVDPGSDPPPVAVRDSRVILTLNPTSAEQVEAGAQVRLSYGAVQEPLMPIRALAPDRSAPTFTNRNVRNLRNDTTNPVLRSATVYDTKLTLTYNELLDPDTTPESTGSYLVQRGEDRDRVRVTRIVVSGRTVELTLASAVLEGQPLFLFVNNVGISDFAGNGVPNIADMEVTYLPPTPVTRPPTGGGIVFPPGGGGGGGGGVTEAAPSTRDFEWTVKYDLDALHSANRAPTGLWSDGATLWVADNPDGAGDGVYAYDLESGERAEGLEFQLSERNRAPRGIWSDGTVAWVSDSGRDRLFAYDLESREQVEEREIELAERNRDARDVWSDGQTMWVLDGVKDSLFAYELEAGALLGEYALDSRNSFPQGIWSDGTSVWVSDAGTSPRSLFAYRLPVPAVEQDGDGRARLERVRKEDFTQLSRASNNSPRGIWSDGAFMYIADASDGKVYTYNMPDALDARLASLALSGVEIGDFDPLRTSYAGAPGERVTTTTVEAAAVQQGTRIVIEPEDANPGAAGHQVALAGLQEITVSVTSQDGSRTRVYRVALEGADEQPWAHCLKGAVAEGLSLVVYEGGSVAELAACAESRGIGALYVLHEGGYLVHIPGAADFVNEAFAAVYADGVPALTPLLVWSAGPAGADPVGEVGGPAGAACFHGSEAGAGWSLVLHEGGSLADLASCAGDHAVAAVWALHGGEWVGWIAGASDEVNRSFAELYAEGLPPLTPLIVRGESPAPGSVAGAGN